MQGGVARNSGAGSYDLGSKISLEAVAASGYEFAGWTLPDGTESLVNPLEVTVEVGEVVCGGVRGDESGDHEGRGGHDITDYLDVPSADAAGSIDLTKATVKEAKYGIADKLKELYEQSDGSEEIALRGEIVNRYLLKTEG